MDEYGEYDDDDFVDVTPNTSPQKQHGNNSGSPSRNVVPAVNTSTSPSPSPKVQVQVQKEGLFNKIKRTLSPR